MGEIYWIGEAEKCIERTKGYNLDGDFELRPVSSEDEWTIRRREFVYDSERRIYVRLPVHWASLDVRNLNEDNGEYWTGRVNRLILGKFGKAIRDSADIESDGFDRNKPYLDVANPFGWPPRAESIIAVRLAEIDEGVFDSLRSGAMPFNDFERKYLTNSHYGELT